MRKCQKAGALVMVFRDQSKHSEVDGCISGSRSVVFDTPCQARTWLKAITESLITLVEQDVIDGFETDLTVWMEDEQDG